MRKAPSLAFGLIFSTLSIFGCGQKSPQSAQLANVFGADNRVELSSDKYPWRTIGMVSVGCTGTLVAKDLVLTAAHCVIDPNTKKLRSDIGYFYPNYKNGSHADQSSITHVWWGTNDPVTNRGTDWALLRLQQSLGDKYGWLGAQPTTASTFPDKLTVAGYSGDFRSGQTAGVHHNCTTKGRDTARGLIMHDCDTARGSSGGPVLRMHNNQLTVYGINVAELRDNSDSSLHLGGYDSNHANIAIPSAGFLQQLKQLTK